MGWPHCTYQCNTDMCNEVARTPICINIPHNFKYLLTMVRKHEETHFHCGFYTDEDINVISFCDIVLTQDNSHGAKNRKGNTFLQCTTLLLFAIRIWILGYEWLFNLFNKCFLKHQKGRLNESKPEGAQRMRFRWKGLRKFIHQDSQLLLSMSVGQPVTLRPACHPFHPSNHFSSVRCHRVRKRRHLSPTQCRRPLLAFKSPRFLCPFLSGLRSSFTFASANTQSIAHLCRISR